MLSLTEGMIVGMKGLFKSLCATLLMLSLITGCANNDKKDNVIYDYYVVAKETKEFQGTIHSRVVQQEVLAENSDIKVYNGEHVEAGKEIAQTYDRTIAHEGEKVKFQIGAAEEKIAAMKRELKQTEPEPEQKILQSQIATELQALKLLQMDYDVLSPTTVIVSAFPGQVIIDEGSVFNYSRAKQVVLDVSQDQLKYFETDNYTYALRDKVSVLTVKSIIPLAEESKKFRVIFASDDEMQELMRNSIHPLHVIGTNSYVAPAFVRKEDTQFFVKKQEHEGVVERVANLVEQDGRYLIVDESIKDGDKLESYE
jgi:hypothetical protein